MGLPTGTDIPLIYAGQQRTPKGGADLLGEAFRLQRNPLKNEKKNNGETSVRDDLLL